MRLVANTKSKPQSKTKMPEKKFTVGKGEMHGSPQLTFYYAGKVTLKDLLEAVEQHFPGVDFNDLNLFPSPVCTITTGKSLEVPPT